MPLIPIATIPVLSTDLTSHNTLGTGSILISTTLAPTAIATTECASSCITGYTITATVNPTTNKPMAFIVSFNSFTSVLIFLK